VNGLQVTLERLNLLAAGAMRRYHLLGSPFGEQPMRYILAAVVLISISPLAFCQDDQPPPGPTTAPTRSAADIEEIALLKSIVADQRAQLQKLQREVDKLIAENKQLHQQLGPAAAQANPGQAANPTSTYASRANALLQSQLDSGAQADTISWMRASYVRAQQIDNQLTAYFRKHPEIDSDTQAAIWAGELNVGMPWEAIKITLFQIHTVSETESGNEYEGRRAERFGDQVLVTVENGKITTIFHENPILSPAK
jgi:hypothetical protein